MHINRLILVGQVRTPPVYTDGYAVFGIEVDRQVFAVYVFDKVMISEALGGLSEGDTVQVDGRLSFDGVSGVGLYVAVTSDRPCDIRVVSDPARDGNVRPRLMGLADAASKAAAGAQVERAASPDVASDDVVLGAEPADEIRQEAAEATSQATVSSEERTVPPAPTTAPSAPQSQAQPATSGRPMIGRGLGRTFGRAAPPSPSTEQRPTGRSGLSSLSMASDEGVSTDDIPF